jgi:hypothetical protein
MSEQLSPEAAAQCLRIQGMVNRILDVLNEVQEGVIGEKIHALAFATGQMLLHIGGPQKMDLLVPVFLAMLREFKETLGPDEITMAQAIHESLQAQLKGEAPQ